MFSSVRAKVAMMGIVGVVVGVLVSVASIAVEVRREYPGDCNESRPFSKPLPGRDVFVAKIVHVDSIIGAVAIVEERFSDLPSSKFVFLKGGRQGDFWFIDGRATGGWLTRHVFPVIDTKCTGSAPIQDAKVDLRLLRQGERDGVRIIGRTLKSGSANSPTPGVSVVIRGPMGAAVITTTDKDGIYDVGGLSPGHYSIRAEYASCPEYGNVAELKSGDVWGCTLRVP
jgi:hypothetical protein